MYVHSHVERIGKRELAGCKACEEMAEVCHTHSSHVGGGRGRKKRN